ncbi:unnamed protein product [Candidula unifasciata]|uniref:Protein dopey-1 homolog n=1 Tax=Candidula unifasciata TaxID=100452 RepID=A0A8S4A6Q8_9EUPU|nr:unnamed protein product [Candidula unifasciata]
MSWLTVEECELLGDAKYRSYITQIEKILLSFDCTNEPATIISALGRLNKILLSNLRYPVIPKKLMVGKCLAQCLHPSLPSSVHLKTLETYDIIFKCIGTQRLAHDLFIYSPVLLTVYEMHFVPLGAHLKPGLNGLLLGLLPGLEEGAEFFDRTNMLLEDICEAVELQYFSTCVWECVLSCPSARPSGTLFLLNHLRKLHRMEDRSLMIGFNTEIVVGAVCACLDNRSVVIQRNILEFLHLAIPLDCSQLTRADFVRIMEAAIKVVLCQDGSLSRRLYAWILGTPTFDSHHSRQSVNDSTTTRETGIDFFKLYSRDVLICALKRKLARGDESSSVCHLSSCSATLQVLQILKTFMSKPEIGPVVIESVLLSVFQQLEAVASYRLQGCDGKENAVVSPSSSLQAEIHKAVNGLIGLFPPCFIWDFLARKFSESFTNEKENSESSVDEAGNNSTSSCHGPMENMTVSELCHLTELLLDIVAVDELHAENSTLHLPSFLKKITISLTTACNSITNHEVTTLLCLCSKILSKIQQSIPGQELNHTRASGSSHNRNWRQHKRNSATCEQQDVGKYQHNSSSLSFSSSLQEREVSSSHQKGGASRLENAKDSGRVKEEWVPLHKNMKCVGDSNNNHNVEIELQTSPRADRKLQGENVNNSHSYSHEDEICLENTRAQSGLHSSGLDNKLLDSVILNADGKIVVASSEDLILAATPALEPDVIRLPVTVEEQNIHSREISPRKHSKLTSNESEEDSCSDTASKSAVSKTTCCNLLQHCFSSFHQFFHKFCQQNILTSAEFCIKCMDNITSMPSSSCLRTVPDQGVMEKLQLKGSIDDLVCAYRQACRLLVDFAAVPVCCVEPDVVPGQMCGNNEMKIALPDWLQDLLICSCFVDSFEVGSISVSVLLELGSLCQAVQKRQEIKSDHQAPQSVSDGRTLAILPGLLNHHLAYISQQTGYYQVVAGELWEYMSETHLAYHQRAAELFHTLHQLAPESTVCEDVIGHDLIHESEAVRILAFKKFSMLWHLTRSMSTDISLSPSPRTFDRSMFVMLDSLKEESSITKTLALTWLTHVIQQGDINRVLQPLLLTLLHPDTARVSIQHVDLDKAKRVSLFDTGQKGIVPELFSVTSERNSIMLPESQDKHLQRTNKKVLQKATEDLKQDSFSEREYRYTSAQTYPHVSINLENNIALANGFGSQNSLDKLIFADSDYPQVAAYGMNKLASDDRTQAYRDLKGHSDNSCSSSKDVAQWIMDGIISSAMVEAVDFETLSESDDGSEKTLGPFGSSGSLDSLSDGDNEGSQRLFNAGDVSFNFTHSSDRNEGRFDFDDSVVSKRKGNQSADARCVDIKMDVQQLHEHMLLYTQQFDYSRTLYAMSTLRIMLQACPRLLVTALSTTSLSSLRATQLLNLQSLLGRHHRCVFGDDFFTELDPEALSGFRTKMYIEIIIIVCLRFMQSYYSSLVAAKLSSEDLHGNQMVSSGLKKSVEVLTLLVSELLAVMKDSGWNFVSYISDLISRCRLQKMVLHRLLASVYRARCIQTVVDYSESNLDPDVRNTFQIKLLQLVQVVIKLQDHMCAVGEDAGHPVASERPRPQFMVGKFSSFLPVIQQDMLLTAVLSSLRQPQLHHLHTHWVHLAMPRMVVSVVLQLCSILELTASEIIQKIVQRLPPDYLVCMLEGLTTLYHYCLMDNANPVSICQPAPASANIPVETTSAGQILANLVHVFNPVLSGKEPGPATRDTTPVSPVLVTRAHLLSMLPRIVACMAGLWKAVASTASADDSTCATELQPLGDVRAIRHEILELLSPISLTHGTHFLAAFAVAWNDRRKKPSHGSSSKQQPVLVETCDDQLLLVELVAAIRVLPVDTLIQTVKQVLRQPPPTELTKKDLPLEVSLLQLFWTFVRHSATSLQLLDSWPSLLTLFKECLQMSLSPPALFLLLRILSEIVMKTPAMEEKRNQKELQDISGSSLEQRAWLRRNYAVRVGTQTGSEDGAEIFDDTDTQQEASTVKVAIRRSQATDSRYSVQALFLLAELTSHLLDVVYSSEEKFKVAPFLTTLLYNVFPYLRNHSMENMASFRACSQILSSISGYQYTRKAWRKEAFEMLLAPAFFQMDVASIASWRTIIDHLMTHDKTTFKDLLGRVSVTQSASLNLFTTKEQECDLRALMMKRLAFTIFCSEADQYQRAMPEIQERLTECLRLPQVANVMSSVFLCFRVLILRMSARHLLSLWPTIITEMVHVLLQIEQELSVDSEDFKIQIEKIAALDSSWAHLGNGLNAHNNPAWLQLYLNACKLLDLCLALPADQVPQFQLYRWAFVGLADEEGPCLEKETSWHNNSYFTPHISRLSHLLNNKLKKQPILLKTHPGRPLLTLHRLQTLSELQPFFSTLCDSVQSQGSVCVKHQGPQKEGSASPAAPLVLGKKQESHEAADGADTSRNQLVLESNKAYIEKWLERDFLEPLT